MARIAGKNSADVLLGTAEDDLLLGKGGADRLNARAGDDVMRGGDDNDTLNGGGGSDRLFGNNGDDLIRGQGGNDFAQGGAGNDQILGGAGRDTLVGNAGDDELQGGGGNDVLRGGSGNDTLIGDAGDDIMRGNGGNDVMIWNPGDGSDTMQGGGGNDVAIANGGDSDEQFTLAQQGNRAIFNRVDPSPFSLDIASTEVIITNGGAGNDSFQVDDLSTTRVRQVTFSGGEGNDTLNAGNTSTALVADGGTGDDSLLGGSAADVLEGGDGNDTIDGSGGDDTMLGGNGDDRLIWNPGGGSDAMIGGEGNDTAVANGGGADERFSLQQSEGQAIFDRLEPSPFTLTITEAEVMEVNGNDGNDILSVLDLSNTAITQVTFDGGAGNDTLDAGNTSVALLAAGGTGDDSLIGGSAADVLGGGDGNDTIDGSGGDDTMLGGTGDDRLIWNPGGGSDGMVGGEGTDTTVANGGGADEQFSLRQRDGQVIFDRLEPSPFTLTITEAEVMEVNGNDGNDVLGVLDLSNTAMTQVNFNGGAGNDTLDATNANVPVFAVGGEGEDSLLGGTGADTLAGGAEVDLLSGGAGSDRFVYSNDALGADDRITDFAINADQFAVNAIALGFDDLLFRNDNLTNLAGNDNLLILQGQTFANAGEAAEAIAKNDAITAEAGLFVYFNQTRGFARLVHSENLGAGDEFTVLANLENITDVAALATFTAENFVVV